MTKGNMWLLLTWLRALWHGQHLGVGVAMWVLCCHESRFDLCRVQSEGPIKVPAPLSTPDTQSVACQGLKIAQKRYIGV
jgi:hypothetical protein